MSEPRDNDTSQDYPRPRVNLEPDYAKQRREENEAAHVKRTHERLGESLDKARKP